VKNFWKFHDNDIKHVEVVEMPGTSIKQGASQRLIIEPVFDKTRLLERTKLEGQAMGEIEGIEAPNI
jgi:hypothetical protein